MSILRHSAWSAAAAIVLAGSRFAVTAILARRLSQGTFGQYAYAQWLVDISFLFCSAGLPGAISRFAAQYSHAPLLLSSLFRRWWPLAIGLSLLTGLAVLCGAWASRLAMFPDDAPSLLVWAIASAFWAMQTAALIGLKRFDLIFRANTIVAAVTLAGAALLPSAADIADVVKVMALASIMASTVGTSTTKTFLYLRNVDIDPSLWRVMKSYAANIWISSLITSLVWSRGEFPMIKSALGDLAMAQYTVAITTYAAAIQGVMLAVSAVIPHLASLWGQGRKEEAVSLSRSVMDMQLAVIGPGALVFLLFGDQLIEFVFSASYAAAAPSLHVLTLGLWSLSVSAQTQLLQIETNARFNRNALVVTVTVLYILLTALIYDWGILGAAVARSGAMIFIAMATLVWSVKVFGSRSVSFANIALVACVLIAVFAIQMGVGSLGLMQRVVLFLISSGGLLLGLRDQNGQQILRAGYRWLVRKKGLRHTDN
jgi:O-antigen/teichoic acid export membrane protein